MSRGLPAAGRHRFVIRCPSGTVYHGRSLAGAPLQYRFATFLLDLDRYELRSGDGRVIELSPRPFELLRYLVEQAPRAVPREELLEKVWTDVHTLEGVLNQAVSQLRRALSAFEGGEEVIETVRGRGYRIEVPVERVGGPASSATPSRAAGARRARTWLPLTAAAVAATGLVAWLGAEPPSRRAELAPEASAPLNPRAIAVLPFENLGADEASGYFGDGLAEEITHALVQNGGLDVVARTSAFAFRGSEVDVREVGRSLGVAYVLEGSVRRGGDELRVAAQLVDARSGLHFWSTTWERSLEDVFAMQQEIAAGVVERIAEEVEVEARPLGPDSSRPRSFAAYDAYLRGVASLRLRDRASVEEAIGHFEEALVHDPDYADAWAGLGGAVGEYWTQFSTEPDEGPLRTRSKAAVERALELDPDCANALRQKAHLLEISGDLAGARALMGRALRSRPESVEVRLSFGALLLRHGEIEEAIAMFEEARRMDPYSSIANLQLGRAYYYGGRTEQALPFLERASLLSSESSRASAQLSMAYRSLGRDEDAREAFLALLPAGARPLARALTRLVGGDRFLRGYLAYRVLRSGDECGGSPEFAAHAFAAVGDADAMFTCLRREVMARHPWYLAVHPVFDPYRSDPRFDELLEAAQIDRVEPTDRDVAAPGPDSG